VSECPDAVSCCCFRETSARRCLTRRAELFKEIIRNWKPNYLSFCCYGGASTRRCRTRTAEQLTYEMTKKWYTDCAFAESFFCSYRNFHQRILLVLISMGQNQTYLVFNDPDLTFQIVSDPDPCLYNSNFLFWIWYIFHCDFLLRGRIRYENYRSGFNL